MTPSRPSVGVVAVAALVVLAGCGQLFGAGGESPSEETLTPAPVPSVTTAAPTPTATDTDTDTVAGAGQNPSRYDSLRPTCTRPPALVVYIQVSALANNDPETNDGIAVTWRFAAPSNKRYVGPYDSFVETITSSYRPLLDAETMTYGPMERDEDQAERLVTVASNGTSTTYRWSLRKVTDTPLAGCWMTTGVREIQENTTADGTS